MKAVTVVSLFALHSWPHSAPLYLFLLHWQRLVSCLCVCCRLNKLCVDQHMEGKHELVNGKSHSLTSSALVDGPIQTQTLTPSRSAGPLSTTGEETQIRETVSKMNHSAKMTLVTEKKQKFCFKRMQGRDRKMCFDILIPKQPIIRNVPAPLSSRCPRGPHHFPPGGRATVQIRLCTWRCL